MRVPFINLDATYKTIKPEIDQAINQVFESSSFIGGNPVAQFSSEFASIMNVPHCIPCANGTDSMEILLRAKGIGPGDEVIVPALTWISAAEVVSLVGATPVFADVHRLYHTMDIASLEERISPRTKAIIPVHLYGMSADMDSIMTIGKQHNLFVIEDCAHAHGATYRGRKVGGIGDAGSFSFYPTKNLGAYGDGGCIITHDSELADRCRLIANHGQWIRDEHLILGRNSRLDTLQAAILCVKLRYLEKWNTQRMQIAEMYNRALASIDALGLPQERPASSHVYHLYVVTTTKRDLLKTYLSDHGVETAIHYPHPLHKIPIYAIDNPPACPNAEQLCESVLSLPIFPGLSEPEIAYVSNCIKEFFV